MATTWSSSISASGRRRALTPEPRREAALFAVCRMERGGSLCVPRLPSPRVEGSIYHRCCGKILPLICSFVWLQRCTVAGSPVTACIVIGNFVEANVTPHTTAEAGRAADQAGAAAALGGDASQGQG